MTFYHKNNPIVPQLAKLSNYCVTNTKTGRVAFRQNRPRSDWEGWQTHTVIDLKKQVRIYRYDLIDKHQ